MYCNIYQFISAIKKLEDKTKEVLCQLIIFAISVRKEDIGLKIALLLTLYAYKFLFSFYVKPLLHLFNQSRNMWQSYS